MPLIINLHKTNVYNQNLDNQIHLVKAGNTKIDRTRKVLDMLLPQKIKNKIKKLPFFLLGITDEFLTISLK